MSSWAVNSSSVGTGTLVERATEFLRPHPTYERLCTPMMAARVRRVAVHPGPVREALLTTATGIIIDGYARWRVAIDRKQATLPCIEHALSDADALLALLRHHRGSTGLNDFCRIVLALELEPSLKGFGALSPTPSSNLTNLKGRDVRPEIAKAAGVSTGNVTKVKQLIGTVIPEVRAALIRGEIRIHRAWQWRTQSHKDQLNSLWVHLNQRSAERTISGLINAHVRNVQPVAHDTADAMNSIARGLGLQDVVDLTVAVLEVPGKAVVLTRALYDEVRRNETRG